MYNNNNDIRKGNRAEPHFFFSFAISSVRFSPICFFSFHSCIRVRCPHSRVLVHWTEFADFRCYAQRRYVHIISAVCLFVVACSIINLNNVNIHGTYRAAEWQWEHKQIQTRRGARGTNWQTLCNQMNHCILYKRNLTKIDWSILFTIHHE